MLQALQDFQLALITALAQDATTPFGTYSIDGQSVSRDRWRLWAGEYIKTLNELIQMAEPYEIKSYGV